VFIISPAQALHTLQSLVEAVGRARYNLKSRFLDALPEEALKWLSPKVQQHHWFGLPRKAAWDDAPESGANTIAQAFARKDLGWRIGETVSHQRFGEGVIVNIEGSGSNCRAQINFGKHGMKLLDLNVAKLERVG